MKPPRRRAVQTPRKRVSARSGRTRSRRCFQSTRREGDFSPQAPSARPHPRCDGRCASRTPLGNDAPLEPYPNVRRWFEKTDSRPAAVRAAKFDAETLNALFPQNVAGKPHSRESHHEIFSAPGIGLRVVLTAPVRRRSRPAPACRPAGRRSRAGRAVPTRPASRNASARRRASPARHCRRACTCAPGRACA